MSQNSTTCRGRGFNCINCNQKTTCLESTVIVTNNTTNPSTYKDDSLSSIKKLSTYIDAECNVLKAKKDLLGLKEYDKGRLAAYNDISKALINILEDIDK